MGILDALISIGAQYGGYKLKQSAQQKADEQRNAILAQMQQINSQAANDQIYSTRQQVQQYAPERRLSALDDAERVAIQRHQNDITAPGAVADGPVYSGKTSEAFTEGKARQVADDLGYATRLARIMGRAAAPADTALQEGFSNTNAALDRSRIRSNARGNLGVRGLALNQVQPNPGRLFAGDVLQGAGLMYGARGGAQLVPWGAR